MHNTGYVLPSTKLGEVEARLQDRKKSELVEKERQNKCIPDIKYSFCPKVNDSKNT